MQKKKILPPHTPYPVGFKNIKNDSEKAGEDKKTDSQTKIVNDENSKKTDDVKNKVEENDK